MRILMLIAVGLAFVVSSGPSMAQKINSSLYPWERKAGQLRGVTQRDPMAKIRARDEKGLKILGLPSNKKFPGIRSPSTEASGTVGLDRYANLDDDSDGYISRHEYMTDRLRVTRAGPAGESKRLRHQSKLADRNRDGKVSSREISDLRNPRF